MKKKTPLEIPFPTTYTDVCIQCICRIIATTQLLSRIPIFRCDECVNSVLHTNFHFSMCCYEYLFHDLKYLLLNFSDWQNSDTLVSYFGSNKVCAECCLLRLHRANWNQFFTAFNSYIYISGYKIQSFFFPRQIR